MTAKQQALLDCANRVGVVRVFNVELRTARALVKAGYGLLSSNPGAAYRGPTIGASNPNGAYYVGPSWQWDQSRKCFARNTSSAAVQAFEKDNAFL